MAVTIKELSAACGLSVSTISKALNDYPDVSAETREHVRRIAAKMGYRPSAIARGLKIGRTFSLGVLYNDDSASGLTHSYFSPVWRPSRPRPSAADTTSHSSRTAWSATP